MAKSPPAFRAVQPPGDPGAAHDCVNIERLKGELGVQLSGLEGDMRTSRQMISDLRVAVSEIPREVTAQIDREAKERATRLKRGEGHFDEIFNRLGKLEKTVLALWIMIGVVGGVKLLIWCVPAVGRLF